MCVSHCSVFYLLVFIQSATLFLLILNSIYLHLEWLICKDLLLPSYCLSSSWFLSSLFLFSSVSTCFCKLVVSHGGMLSSLFYVLWMYSRFFIVVITSSLGKVTALYLLCQKGSHCHRKTPNLLPCHLREGDLPWQLLPSSLYPNAFLSNSNAFWNLPVGRLDTF